MKIDNMLKSITNSSHTPLLYWRFFSKQKCVVSRSVSEKCFGVRLESTVLEFFNNLWGPGTK
jgi:hypothetical protein